MTEFRGEELTAQLAVAPEFDAAMAAAAAASVINYIRVTVYLVSDNSVIGQTVVPVDPNAASWTLDVSFTLPNPLEPIYVTIELLYMDASTSNVEWSGKSEPILPKPGPGNEAPSVPMGRGPLENASVTSVIIDEPVPDLTSGRTVTISATATTTDPNSTPEIFWTSLNPNIVSVEGPSSSTTWATTLTARAVEGSARIVASAGTVADTVQVTVVPRILFVDVHPDAVTVESLGEEIIFIVFAMDEATHTHEGGFTWEIEDESILEYLGSNTFRALAPGQTVVVATYIADPTKSGAATVTVQQRVASVEVLPNPATISSPDETQQFQARAFDANGNLIEGMTFDWSTSDGTKATIDANGLATGLSQGTVTVYAAATTDVMGVDGATASASGAERSSAGAEANSAGVEAIPTQGTVGEATLTVEFGLDLKLEKLVSEASPAVGATIEYVLRLTNRGPSNAHNVVVMDQLPPQLTYLNHEGFGDYDPVTGLWTVPELISGATAILDLTVRVGTGTAGQAIVNTATIQSSDETDTNGENDSASVTVSVAAVDIAVEKETDNTGPAEGEAFTFTIKVTNHGPDDATNVVVRDILSEDLEYLGQDASLGTYVQDTGFWTIPSLAKDQSAKLVIKVAPHHGTVGQPIINLAFLSGVTQTDTNSDNNQDQVTVIPQGVDIGVEKEVDDAAPAEGQEITYLIEVENHGAVEATGVEVQDLLPEGVTHVRHTATSGSYSEGSGVWAIPSMAPEQSDTLWITVTVNPGTVGVPITNSASVATVDQTDIDETNDSGSVQIVPQGVDIALYKDADSYDPGEGQEVTYTIKAENLGLVGATNVVVEDVLPAGLTLVTDNTSAGPFDNVTGIWEIPTLPAGAFETLTITARVEIGTAGQVITNTANVLSVDQTDGNGGNNSSSIDILPQGVDIAVMKDVDVYEPGELQPITYTVTVENWGNVDATNVVVTDQLPAGVGITGHNAGAGGYDPGSGIWSVGTILPGGSHTLTINAVVEAGTAGQNITNTATVTGVDQTDMDGTNDSGSIDITPLGVDIEITKTVDNDFPAEGEAVVYSVNVTNFGSIDASNITVLDNLPGGVSILGHDAGPANAAYDPGTGVYGIANLAAGATATLTINAGVDLGTAGTTITNTATLTGVDQTDIDGANDSASIDIFPQGLDLLLTKDAGVYSPQEGDPVLYTVTLTNVGPAEATNVVVTDVLPAGVTHVNNAVSSGGYDAVSGIWTIPGPIPASGVETLEITVTVDPATANQTITNTAAITSVDQTETDATNNSASIDITPLGLDLQLTKTVDDPTPDELQQVVYTVQVENLGPANATGLIIDDLLPAGQLTFVSATPPAGTSYDQGTGHWDLGTLASGGVASLQITATVNAGTQGTTITNTASVFSVDQSDNYLPNNTASADVVPQGVDVSVTKTVSDAAPGELTLVTYTLTVENWGPGDATNLIIQDILEGGITYISDVASAGSYDNGTGDWVFPALPAGTQETLAITVRVNDFTAGTTINNAAALTVMDQTDIDTSDNSAEVTITPQGKDIEVLKTVNNASPLEGEEITYTVTVNNLGPGNANNITVRDTIPTGLTLTSTNMSAGTWDGVNEVWTIPSLDAGTSATLTITATVDAGLAGQSRQNEAQLTGVDGTELNPPNDVGLASITVQGVDISVDKTLPAGIYTAGDTVEFRVTAGLLGSVNATNIQISDAIPAGTTFAGYTSTNGTYDSGTGIWTIPSKLAGSPVDTLYLKLAILSGTTSVSNTATFVSVDQTDTNAGNNSRTHTFSVLKPDVRVTKTVDLTDVSEESQVTFTITAENTNSQVRAISVLVNDLLPTGLNHFSSNPSQGIYDYLTGAWNVGVLAPSATATLTITAAAATGTAGTTLTNTASLTSVYNGDSNPANDSGSAAVNVHPLPAARTYDGLGNTDLVAGGYTTPPSTPYTTDPNSVLSSTPTLTVTSTGTITTTNGGTVDMEADGDFKFTPAVGDYGPDTFTYTVITGESNTVTINLATPVWYVDNSVGTTGTGSSTSPFLTLAEAAAASVPPVASPAPAPSDPDLDAILNMNDEIVSGPWAVNEALADYRLLQVAPAAGNIFLFNGTGASYGAGITLQQGQTLYGEGDGLTIAPFGTIISTGTRPTLSDGLVLGTNSTVQGLNVSGAAGHGLQAGTGVSGVTVTNVDISNAGDSGIRLTSPTGSFTFSGVSIGNTAGAAFYVSGGDAVVDYQGGITQGSGNGNIFTVESTAGGSTTFGTGPFSSNYGGGVLINLADGNVDVTQTLSVTNPTGTGLNINGSTGNMSLSNLNITTNGHRGVSLTSNTTGTITISDGTLNTTDSEVVFFQGSGVSPQPMNVSLSSVTGVNNLAVGTATVYLENLSGTTSFGTLDLTTAHTGGGVYAAAAGTVAVTNTASSIVATGGGSAIQAVSGTNLDMSFGTVSATDPNAAGIYFYQATGSFSATGGTLSNPVNMSAAALNVNQGTADITYGGTINNSTAGAWSVFVHGREATAGTVTLNGAITDSGRGVQVGSLLNTADENAGGTVRFAGGLNLTGIGLGSGPPFLAGSTGTNGTIEVTGTGNTIAPPVGTAGLDITNTTIGPNGVTFESISVDGNSGGASPPSIVGINLKNTGAGPFKITGDPLSGQVPNRSGGIVKNITGDGLTTGHGMVLDNVQNVDIAYMGFTTFFYGHAITGSNVTGFKLAESLVEVSGQGWDDYHLLDFTELTGTGLVQNDTLRTSGGHCVSVINSSGTVDLTIDNSTISTCTGEGSGGEDGVHVEASGSATFNTFVKNGSTLQNAAGDGLDVAVSGTGEATIDVDATGGANTFKSNNENGIKGSTSSPGSGGTSLAVSVKGAGATKNLFQTNSGNLVAGTGSIALTQTANSSVTFDIQDNTFDQESSAGLFVADAGTTSGATMEGNFINNTLTGITGATGKPAIDVNMQGAASGTVRLENNSVTVTEGSQIGIQALLGGGAPASPPQTDRSAAPGPMAVVASQASRLDLTLWGNSVSLPTAVGYPVNMSVGGTHLLCAKVFGNEPLGPTYGIKVENGSTSRLWLEDYHLSLPSQPTPAQVTAYLESQNDATSGVSYFASNDIESMQYGTCLQPFSAAPSGTADVEVRKTSSAPLGYPSDPFTYTVVVKNRGPAAATGIVVADTISPRRDLNWTPSQGSWTLGANTGQGTWNVGTLAPGDSATLTASTTVAGLFIETNSAMLQSLNETDPTAANDTASASIEGVLADTPETSQLRVTAAAFEFPPPPSLPGRNAPEESGPDPTGTQTPLPTWREDS